MVNIARRLDFGESDEEMVGFTSGSDDDYGSEPGSDSAHHHDFDSDSETEKMDDGMQTPVNYAVVGPYGLEGAPSPQPPSPVQTGTPQHILVNIQMVLQWDSPVALPPDSPQFH